MNENVIGKEVVDAAVKVSLAPGCSRPFGCNLMKDGIKRVVNGPPEENLGGFAALRDTPNRWRTECDSTASVI